MAARQETIDADYVVVGAGSAGCVMAARLSEDPATRVVLLEAGGHDRHFWIHVPLGYGKTITDPRVNWCYETEPEPNLNGRRVLLAARQGAGRFVVDQRPGLYPRPGAGFRPVAAARQYRLVVRRRAAVFPPRRTSDRAARATCTAPAARSCVSDMPDYDPISKAFIKSALDLGFPRNDDFNGAVQEGVGYYQLTTRNGRRCSTAVGYLRPAMKRPNLRVITNALSERITLDGRRATGVTFRQGGELHTVRARARGDPVRRRDQLAATDAAVRHRSGSSI